MSPCSLSYLGSYPAGLVIKTDKPDKCMENSRLYIMLNLTLNKVHQTGSAKISISGSNF